MPGNIKTGRIPGGQSLRPENPHEPPVRPRGHSHGPVPAHVPGIAAGAALAAQSRRHRPQPKLQRFWGPPAPFHDAIRTAAEIRTRSIRLLVGTNANAREAATLAETHLDHSIFAIRSDHFDENVGLPDGHLVLYRGQWNFALEGIIPGERRFGLITEVFFNPETPRLRTVPNPWHIIRKILAASGALHIICRTKTDAEGYFNAVHEAFQTPNDQVFLLKVEAKDSENITTTDAFSGRITIIDGIDSNVLANAWLKQPESNSPVTEYYRVLAMRSENLP